MRRATVTSSTVIVILYNFYPRSPCGERHGETMPSIGHISYFYPRSPCGERLDVNNPVAALTSISIHALLAESDCYSLRHSAQGRYFYPRSPCGERLDWYLMILEKKDFYPRSPCGERLDWYLMILEKKDFYPRSPCGERPPRLSRVVPTPIFLSTLSLRRATNNINSSVNTADQISIHALLAESDSFRPSD